METTVTAGIYAIPSIVDEYGSGMANLPVCLASQVGLVLPQRLYKYKYVVEYLV